MNTIYAANVPQAYTESIIMMKMWGVEERSRNGPVLTSLNPVLLQISNSKERVLFDKIRNCNPFFHVMEWVWMVTGSNDVRWIERFNKRFRMYADPGMDHLHSAYGHRWRKHFGRDQIQEVANLFRQDYTSRRGVIGMWDPGYDLDPHNDLPCNTHIMFRIIDNALDMTVVNRSNDLIWGMLGANAVHMTYLHELMSLMLGIRMGLYKVFTNNLHVYTEMDNFERIWGTILQDDPYREGKVTPYPLLTSNETYEQLISDCEHLIADGDNFEPKTFWMGNVALPMFLAYMDRLQGGDGADHIRDIRATDWRLACENYVELRKK